MNVDLINIIIKIFFINIFSFITTIKIVNYKNMKCNKYLLIFLVSVILTLLYIVLKPYINVIFIIILSLCIQIFILNNIINKKYLLTIPVLMANAIVYAVFTIAAIIETIPREILKIENSIVNFIIIIIIEIAILLRLFKIKRIKNGFSFLEEKSRNGFLDLITINISSIIILAYGLLSKYHGSELIRHEIITLVTLIVFMILIIQKTLNIFYKQNLLKKTIEEYKKEIEDKDKTINELKEEKFKISKINHEFYNRQRALETKIKEMNTETGEEIYILDRVNNLTKEYSNKLQEAKGLSKLPLTQIPEIDDMFNYMQKECYKNGIEFKLQITGNIYHLINNTIPKNKLETLIGDHIRDAIIAVNSSNNSYKSIVAVLGIKDGTYEFCVSDSGIEFEIETLLKLGQEQITTHKDIGGSGIGFITTFETLKECGGSLIIEEYQPEKSSYTKSITIKFDNKNEYKICSYRANEISKKNKENRIIIEEI